MTELEIRKAQLEELKARVAKEEKELELAEKKEASRKAWSDWRVIANHSAAFLYFISHSRSSCSDHNIVNGIHSSEYGPRCMRCAMLEILRGDYKPEDFSIEFDVNIKQIQ